MKRTMLMLCILLISNALLFGAGIDFFSLQEPQITAEVIEQIRLNNEKVDRNAPSWDFGTTSVPVPLPRPSDPLFLEDGVWSKDFSGNIVYSGSGQLFLFYNTPTQRFNITTDPVNPLKLHFTIKQGMEHWYGSETMIIGVSDSQLRDPSRAYATAVVRLTVTPVDDPIILNCPPEFEVRDEFGNLLNYQIPMTEETPLTINFLDYNGAPLIRTVDDLNNFSNYDFFITQTQQIPYDVVITQTPAYTGKTVTFTPRPGFFGEVTFAITNTDNNINGFLDADPALNTCLNVFVLKVSNVNDAPVIQDWTPPSQNIEITQYQSQVFAVRTFDEDDKFQGLIPPATEMSYEWRITGFEYGVPINQVIAHTNSISPGNPLDVLSSVNYTFNYPGTFQLSVVVSDGLVTLPPLVWTINVVPAGPEFTIPGGVYTESVSVGLFSSVSPGSPIYYTLDGSLPDQNSLLFDPANPIVINAEANDVVVTITAVYYDPIYGRSGYTSETYHITGTVVLPVFNLQQLPFVYTSAQQLTITSSTPGHSIRYTTDGTDPNPSTGLLYTGPISIPEDTTLNVRAIAYKDLWLSSPIVEGNFRVSGQVRIDDISFDKATSPFVHVIPVGGTLSIDLTNVLLYPNDANTRLYFTTNNTTPTESSTLYTGQLIEITQSTIIRFRAFRNDWAPSAIQLYEFLINGQIIINPYPNGTVFNPNPNTVYTNQVLVSINSTTPSQNSVIYYTVSDDPNIAPPDPTPASTAYLGAGQIVVPELQPYNVSYRRIKARAYHSFLEPSPVYEVVYTVTGKVQPPIFNPAGGSYATPQLVSIITYAPGAEIRYTTSDDVNIMPPDPTQTDNLYTSPLLIPLGTKVIKARVFKADWAPSDVVTAIYYIGVLDAPTFNPVQELHYNPIMVSINHSDPNVTIRWVEGTGIPTQTSPIYSAPIELTSSRTLTARAFRQDWSPSEAVTKTYTITGTLAPLSFTLPNLPGSYENSVVIGIHSDDPNAVIRLTLDGSEPTMTNGQTYTLPFQVTSTTMVRARAFKQDWLPTGILEGLFEIVSTVASPRFTPPPGIYTVAQDVYILSYTPGAQIRYTLDGSDPSSVNGFLYDADNPIHVESFAFIKAVAYTGNGIHSSIISGTYQITGTVAIPTFDPLPGVYASAQNVSITTATPGAIIYYTTDGSVPTVLSNVFVAGNLIPVTISTVIKAIAMKPDWIDSPVATGSYVINGKVSTPLFIPAAGTYTQEQTVAISVYPSDANIYYTTDGSDPIVDPAYLYSGAIPVNQSTTIKAFAVAPGWQDSDPATATYTLAVLPPLVSHASGLYPNQFNLSLTNQNPGATIYYTTDGSDPIETPDNLYTGAFIVSNNTRVRVIAYRNGWTPSPELDLNYVINPPILTPVFSVADNSILTQVFDLTISTSPADAKIYYTLDGSEPTEFSILYSGPIQIDKNTLIKAKAFKAFHNPSGTASAQYFLRVADPQFNYTSGVYNNYIQVTLTSDTPLSAIRYTTDGSDPSPTVGILYPNAPISVNTNQTIKAIAYRADWLSSTIISKDYSFITAPIVFNPPAGNYEGDIPVILSTATQNAMIRYTLNGDAPTPATGEVYHSPIILNSPTTIKAIAFKDALPPSTAEAHYGFKLPLPVFAYSEGIYNQDLSLEFTAGVAGASIYYTTDGSDPIVNGILYDPINPPSIGSPTTIKAVSMMPGWNPSDINQATYQFKVATPTFTPNPGLYSLPQSIGISSITSNASIYYTTDESTPDNTDLAYNAPILVESGLIVFKAVGTRLGWIDSDIGEAGYIIGSSGGGFANTVETPVFSPAPGTYTTAQTVTITTNTPSTVIKYTLDGSDPSPTNGIDYSVSGPFVLPLESTTTIKAIAYRDGWNNSQMAAGTYIITGTVSNVTFSIPGATYTSPQTVVLGTETEGATIRYTIDGTDPVANSPVYNSGIVLGINTITIVKARAFKSGWTPSAIMNQTYIITGQVSLIAPIVDVSPGNYDVSQTINVTATTFPADAVIRYTIDGSEPDELSPVYSAAFNVPENSSLTIKIKAFKTNWIPSGTYTAAYNVTGTAQLPALVFDPLPGIYQTGQNVSILPASQPSDAVLRYTLDGTEPSELSPAYSGPISLGMNAITIIKVKAYKAGWIPSPTMTGVYTITGQVVYNSPVFSPAPGIYQSAQTITINTAVPASAVIHYTLDGSEPDQNSPVYSGGINLPLNSSLTIKTKAYLNNWTPSITHEATYTVTGQVSIQTPVFNPLPGLYTSPQNVSVTDQTNPIGAIMRYTLDGSEPIESSPVYSGAFAVNTGEVLNLKVRAFAANWIPSVVYSASYTVTGQVSLNSPVFTPTAGIYTNAQFVSLNTASNPVGATLRYTTDGSEPTVTSPVYTAAIPVNNSQTIKVKAFKVDWIPSITYEAVYVITGQVSIGSPVFSPLPGTYQTAQNVAITGVLNPADAVIRYTLDGTDPTAGSSLWTGSLAVGLNSSVTVKIRAFKNNWIASPVYTGIYTVTGQVILPAAVFNPLPGTYQTAQTVTLSPAALPAAATLRYTLDGTEPTILSPAYLTPINLPLNSATTIKVKAYATDWIPSETVSGSYLITGQVVFNSPVFTPAPGIYQTEQNIAINTAVPSSATVRYTTDGSEPTEASALYSSAIILPLGTSLTLKTKAFLTDWIPSETHTAFYTSTGNVSIELPVFSPSPGLYTTPQNVVINTNTAPSGATLRYTLDGSDPNSSSPIYSSALAINTGESVTIRVRAFADNWLPSPIYTGIYTVTGQVSLNNPVFTPAAGIYTSGQMVTLNTASNPVGATLRYTTDGSEPTVTSPVYAAAIPVNNSQTIRVKAFKVDWIPSITYEAVYTITGQVTLGTPLFNPLPGYYQTPQIVNIIGVPSPSDAIIRYTTDGTDPNENSPIYTNPFNIGLNSTQTIKLRAYKTDWIPSPVYSGTYTITGTVLLPATVFTPAAGTYQTAQSVTLNTSTTPAGAVLRYTLDGTEPNELTSPAYTSAIQLPLNSTTTIRVKAFLPNWTPSVTVSAQYVITGTLAINQPVFDPPQGLYYVPQAVSINTTSQAGAVIRYTTNGVDPTETSPIYSAPINIPQGTTTLKVRAYLANWTASPVYAATYQITGQVAMSDPFFSPAPGTYTTAQTVTLNSSTSPSGAVIRFTTDGSIPTATSTIYSGPITLGLNSVTTIRAIAFVDNWLPSEIKSGTYNITGQAAINGTVFTPASGLYTSPIAVSINTVTTPAGATLRYTTDGTEPNIGSPEYTAAIQLPGDSSTTIKVKAFASAWIPSITYEASYTITGTVNFSGTLFDPPAGVYTTAQSVNITAQTYPMAAVIRFTTDGTDPSSSSEIFTSPIQIPLNTESLEIRARAFHPNWIDSQVISAIYTVTGQVVLNSPAISPAPGTYTTAQTLTMSSAVLPTTADIRYTLDGTEPTLTSPAYQNPISLPLNSITTVKLKGFKTDWIPSTTVTAVYNVTGTVADPVFERSGGLFDEAFDLVISTSTEGAEIRYTTDGTEPTIASNLYTQPINIPYQTQNLEIKARAFKNDWVSSGVSSEIYSVLRVPINVRAYSYSGYIRVLWNSPAASRSLDGFKLYRKATGEAGFTVLNNGALINTFDGGFYYYDDYVIQVNTTYSYYVTAVYSGQESLPSLTTSIEYQAGDLQINDNSHAFPNPAVNSTTIRLVLSRNDNVQVSVTIYDFAGKQIRTLTVPATNTNQIDVLWDLRNTSGTKVARGTYFARVVALDGANRSERVLKIAVQ